MANAVFLFLSPVAACSALLYGAAVAPSASAEQAIALGAALGLSLAWRVFLVRRERR